MSENRIPSGQGKYLSALKDLYKFNDIRWITIWSGGILILLIWDSLFLNAPALRQLRQAINNTAIIVLFTIVFSLALGWLTTMLLQFTGQDKWRFLRLPVTFLLNVLRSVPQVIGILLLYVILTLAVQNEWISNRLIILTFSALIVSIFVFLEVSDLLQERILYYKKSDFFNAMRVCGISEFSIINREILFKNSLNHLFNKAVAIAGITVFLQSSVDFIISVGLSTEVSSVNFPVTLGSMLAKIDSKQDILAIGHTLFHPGYFSTLVFNHLQGLSTAFVIVFSLFCLFRIGDGFAKRHRL